VDDARVDGLAGTACDDAGHDDGRGLDEHAAADHRTAGRHGVAGVEHPPQRAWQLHRCEAP
jgi:hypothetical protein